MLCNVGGSGKLRDGSGRKILCILKENLFLEENKSMLKEDVDGSRNGIS